MQLENQIPTKIFEKLGNVQGEKTKRKSCCRFQRAWKRWLCPGGNGCDVFQAGTKYKSSGWLQSRKTTVCGFSSAFPSSFLFQGKHFDREKLRCGEDVEIFLERARTCVRRRLRGLRWKPFSGGWAGSASPVRVLSPSAVGPLLPGGAGSSPPAPGWGCPKQEPPCPTAAATWPHAAEPCDSSGISGRR